MVLTLLTVLFLSGLTLVLGSFLPHVDNLPFGIDGVLYTVGKWIWQLPQFLWPLDIVFHLFFVFFIPFLIGLMILKFVLGSRSPHI